MKLENSIADTYVIVQIKTILTFNSSFDKTSVILIKTDYVEFHGFRVIFL